MNKKQLELEINREFDFGVIIHLYPELGILIVGPFFSVAIRERYGESWFRFINNAKKNKFISNN